MWSQLSAGRLLSIILSWGLLAACTDVEVSNLFPLVTCTMCSKYCKAHQLNYFSVIAPNGRDGFRGSLELAPLQFEPCRDLRPTGRPNLNALVRYSPGIFSVELEGIHCFWLDH